MLVCGAPLANAQEGQADSIKSMIPLDERMDAGLSEEDSIRVSEVSNIIEKKAKNKNKVQKDLIKAEKFARKVQRDWSTWTPKPQRALWLGIVLPGAGQIYNRKYWKLPIVYGGFIGCIYAMRWNNQMYKDYSQAYMDIMDNDPNSQSYNQFLHLGAEINESNMERYQNIFKKRKDFYRRYRDLSMFCLIGVYALSVIDAYVDASLSEFDISDDLSLRVEPAVINNRSSVNPLKSSSLGVQCSLTF